MKKIRNLPESSFLKLFFGVFCLSLLLTAVALPDRGNMFTGLWKIFTSTSKVATNYFALGGYAATFLNMALVGIFCTALCFLPGAKVGNTTTLAVVLTIGFGSWGMHVLNMLPTVLGVVLYCLVKRERLGSQVNAMLFSTGIAPLISELLLRYPGTQYIGFNWLGLGLTVVVGVIIGFFLPAGIAHAPAVHKGYDHYSAALPVGITAFFLRTVLYNVLLGWSIGDVAALSALPAPEAQSWLITNVFCIGLFVLCIIFALLLGCRPRDYLALLKDPGYGVSFSEKYGNAPFLMNVGVFGLMIVAYFNLAGLIDGRQIWTGVIFGNLFCMLATCNSGSHPGNVWPILAGYLLTSFLFGWIFQLLGGDSYSLTIGSQSVLIGVCYANGLSPISGKYGWPLGVMAGGCHYLLVTAVPDLHGGFCLYNGGLTAVLICVLLVPQLERFCKPKEPIMK